MQHCREGHSNCQGLFRLRISKSQRLLPYALMVPPISPCRATIKPPKDVKHGAQSLCICHHPRPAQLQEAPICTAWLSSPDARQTGQQRRIGPTFSSWIEYRNIHGALLNVQSFCKNNEGRESVRHSFFKHKYITQPSVSSGDTIGAAAQQLTAALK